MSGLAHRILRGRVAATLATYCEPMGMHQGRMIVRMRAGEGVVGVFDQLRDELVIFDAAALVALADAETLAVEDEVDAADDVIPLGKCAGMRIIDPPSRL